MVSVGVSKLGYTNSIFVDTGVKVNGAYYHDVLLSQQLLPAICQVYGVLNLWVLNRSSRQCTGRARRSTSFNARLLHLYRQICDRLTTPITVQLTTKSGASASLDKSAQDVGRFEAASDWCLDWYSTKRYLQCHWVTQGRLHTCIQAIGGHFEYSLWLIKQ